MAIDEGSELKERHIGSGPSSKFLIIFASAFLLYHLLYVSDIFSMYLNVMISKPVHLSIHLTVIILLTFLLRRASPKSKSKKPPIYDIILGLIGAGTALYYGIFAYDIIGNSAAGSLVYGINGFILALLLIEASRRLLGTAFAVVVAVFLILPLISGYLPGILNSRSIPFLQWGEFMYGSPWGIFGTPLEIGARIVIIYLLFSQLLIYSGAGEWFINLAYGAFGRFRGGPAKMAVMASGFFGMLSGSPGGIAAATGTFTIPLMKRTGYAPHYAGAIEAVSSLGGIFMPPVMGAVIFLLASFIDMSYVEVMKHAFIPALLYYFCIFLFVDQEAMRLKLQGVSGEPTTPFWKLVRTGFWYLVPVIVLLVLLIAFYYTPEKSAVWASVSVIFLSLFSKKTRLGFSKLGKASEQTLRSVLMVSVATASAGIIIAAIAKTGIAVNLSRELVAISGGNIFFLLLISAIVSFIMGMGVGIIGCYVFLAITICPALTSLGVPPIAAQRNFSFQAVPKAVAPIW